MRGVSDLPLDIDVQSVVQVGLKGLRCAPETVSRGRIDGSARFGVALGASRKGLTRRLVQSRLDLRWFDEFSRYWTEELGQRRIQPHEFEWLHAELRQLFRSMTVSEDGFLDAWQDPRTLYTLFHYVYKHACDPIPMGRLPLYVPKGSRVLEYGCGLAPVTSCLRSYFGHRKLQVVCADIPTLLLSYAGWRFRDDRWIGIQPLDPDEPRLEGTFDVCFLIEVLEHVPDPVVTLSEVTDHLAPGGTLVFDYIESEGTGMDFPASPDARRRALDFLEERYDVALQRSGDIGRTVARLRT